MSQIKKLTKGLAAFAMVASVFSGVTNAKAATGFEAEYSDQSNADNIGGHSLTIGQGETTTVYIKYKNTGSSTWYKNQVNLGPIYSNGDIERTPLFDSNTWFSPVNGGNLRPATLTENAVAPGQVGTFEFELVAEPGQDLLIQVQLLGIQFPTAVL